MTTLETEKTENKGEYRILKDNQLWEKQDKPRKVSGGKQDKPREEGGHIDNGEEAQADGTIEKGLGPTDALVQTGNPYKFQPYTMKILKTSKQKADWQDKDPIIALVKTWLKEDRKPTSTELNYRDPNLQAYRKILAALKLRPVEGTEKTILVREGLKGNMMDRYCLPNKIENQVINDIHLYHMHLGVHGIVRQVQKCDRMPGLHAAVCRELLKCHGCMQKHKIQKDMRVENCFHTKRKDSQPK